MGTDKFLSGLLAFYPWIFCSLACPAMFLFGGDMMTPSNMEAMQTFSSLLNLGLFVLWIVQMAYFYKHLFSVNQIIGDESKLGWALGMFFFGIIAVPMYWSKFIQAIPDDFYDEDYGRF